MSDTAKTPESKLEVRLFRFKKMRVIILFSFVINLLYLTSPLYMMQIYDRVLGSANIPTLIGLTFITALLYCFFGLLDYTRDRVLRANGEVVAQQLSEKAFTRSILNNCEKEPTEEKKQALGDVAVVRNFLTSSTLSAFFDLPWSPLFLLVVFAFHPVLGIFAFSACILLAIVAFLNERLSNAQLKKSSALALESTTIAQAAQRNAVTLRGNGMIKAMHKQWNNSDENSKKIAMDGSRINNAFSTVTKSVSMLLQSLILGLGAYFVIKGELSPGSIIACSVIFTRIVSPLNQILGGYSNIVAARNSWNNVKTWLYDVDKDEQKGILPAPEKSLTVQDLNILPPNDNTKFIIKNVQFSLKAGDVLGISGLSGSGKTTLAKAIIGAWPVAKGKVCLDGADIHQWSREIIGKHIGYLPQEIELFDGTVAQNISRFSEDADFNKILEASQLAGTHRLVLELKDGYNTLLGKGGETLSAGQKQRIAMARALYDNPFLIVLDEPNSNLDSEGEVRLNETIDLLKKNQAIVIFITHRPQLLEKANNLLVMHKGEMKAFGSPDSILKMTQKNNTTSGKQNKIAATPISSKNITFR